MVKKIVTCIIPVFVRICSCTTVKHEYYTISAIPIYDSVGNVYYHEETIDHFPTKEDSVAFIIKSGSNIYKISKREKNNPD